MIPSLKNVTESSSSHEEHIEKKKKELGLEQQIIQPSDASSAPQTELKKRKVKRIKSTRSHRPIKEESFEKKKRREKVALQSLQNSVRGDDPSRPIPEKENMNAGLTSNSSQESRKKHHVKHVKSLQPAHLQKKGKEEKFEIDVVSISPYERNSLRTHQSLHVDTSMIISSSKTSKEKKLKKEVAIAKDEKNQSQEEVKLEVISIETKQTPFLRVKELLNKCDSLTRAEHQELVLFIIQPAYPILHGLCKQKQTEEHMEFLLDYLKWSNIDHKKEFKSYNNALKAIIRTYFKEDSEHAVNVDMRAKKEVKASLTQKDYVQANHLMHVMALNVISMLWNNLFFSDFTSPDIVKLILESLSEKV